MKKPKYSRQDKIEYFQLEVLKAKFRVKQLERILEGIQSDNYQDWDGELQKELDRKKAR